MTQQPRDGSEQSSKSENLTKVLGKVYQTVIAFTKEKFVEPAVNAKEAFFQEIRWGERPTPLVKLDGVSLLAVNNLIATIGENAAAAAITDETKLNGTYKREYNAYKKIDRNGLDMSNFGNKKLLEMPLEDYIRYIEAYLILNSKENDTKTAVLVSAFKNNEKRYLDLVPEVTLPKENSSLVRIREGLRFDLFLEDLQTKFSRRIAENAQTAEIVPGGKILFNLLGELESIQQPKNQDQRDVEATRIVNAIYTAITDLLNNPGATYSKELLSWEKHVNSIVTEISNNEWRKLNKSNYLEGTQLGNDLRFYLNMVILPELFQTLVANSSEYTPSDAEAVKVLKNFSVSSKDYNDRASVLEASEKVTNILTKLSLIKGAIRKLSIYTPATEPAQELTAV